MFLSKKERDRRDKALKVALQRTVDLSIGVKHAHDYIDELHDRLDRVERRLREIDRYGRA